jgi:hypothetical protein
MRSQWHTGRRSIYSRCSLALVGLCLVPLSALAQVHTISRSGVWEAFGGVASDGFNARLHAQAAWLVSARYPALWKPESLLSTVRPGACSACAFACATRGAVPGTNLRR